MDPLKLLRGFYQGEYELSNEKEACQRNWYALRYHSSVSRNIGNIQNFKFEELDSPLSTVFLV
ncbi:MAG: hypothetical protein OM95_03445 [Bdellovibrio sp. ArHS]|uniref:hypothetical protein n=1 Tax=Bdellovibrio sp. ArHS TaxID=1569284 RepID=UPI000582C99D|nr:hypothetical protein [Bdellovibrio sp. ArHS]KHD89431.1 MAG: hypothetical protein OM95_03445 [Bdellovibrio sp. ArHS]